jgi:methionyl-tRNA formyltransferase
MRVSLMGQAAFGEAVFKRLLADSVELVAVSAPAPSGDRKDPLWAAAEAAGLPVIATRSLKTPEGKGAWKQLAADLCVMAFVTDIIPNEVLEYPAKGTIQYHPSLLPLHRGSSAMNWPIINGETETGLSIFWPDQGIDTGPILLQKTTPISPDQTMGDLYFNNLFPMGVEALAESVALVAAGKAPSTEQDHALSTYEPPCGEGHARIRWYKPAEVIYNLVDHLQRPRTQALRLPPDRPAGARHARPRPPHRRRRLRHPHERRRPPRPPRPTQRREEGLSSGVGERGWPGGGRAVQLKPAQVLNRDPSGADRDQPGHPNAGNRSPRP